MTVRTSPRSESPSPRRARRGASALVAQYIRELSTRESDRVRPPVRPVPVTERG